MKILLLEDNPTRIKWFKSEWPSVEGTRLASLALSMMQYTEYDLIFLDHDLGDGPDHPYGTDGVDGTWLSVMMSEWGVQADARIIIHSSNAYSAEKMRHYLARTHPNVEVIPYPRLKEMRENGEFE